MESSREKYDYAFTGAALKFYDFMRLVRHIEEEQLYDQLEKIDYNVVMKRENKRTNRREFQEMIKRYKKLTAAQQQLLLEIDAAGQRQLAFLGACKAHPFIRDFMIEIVREKFLTLDFELTDGDYNSFINRKIDTHPELESFSTASAKKARQVVWRILEEGGMINNTKERRILPQFLNHKIKRSIYEDHPDLFKIFLMPDYELNNLVV